MKKIAPYLKLAILSAAVFFVTSCSSTKSPSDAIGKSSSSTEKRVAMVTVPIGDVLGVPPAGNSKGKQRYCKLPCSYPSKVYSIPRVHQILFNQTVNVLQDYGDEVLIEIPNVVLQTSPSAQQQPLVGWTLKKNIALIKSSSQWIPPAPSQRRSKQKIVTLRYPHYSDTLKTTFSAGTRFVVDEENKKEYVVGVLQPKSKKPEFLSLPKGLCLVNTKRSNKKKVAEFVKLLRLWSNLENGFITYVLGGASWTKSCDKENGISRYTKNDNNSTVVLYERKHMPQYSRSGYDCSSLIYSAAQIVGMPYSCKNTTTIKHQMRQLSKSESLEPGDIILIPGHVLIITEVGNTLKIVQAKGYASGVGKIFEDKGENLFRGIKTADDLATACINKKPLVETTPNGSRTIKDWNIYKIRSCWH